MRVIPRIIFFVRLYGAARGGQIFTYICNMAKLHEKAEERPLKDILFGCIVDVVRRRETQGRIAEAEILKLKLLRAAAASSTNDALSFVQTTNTEVHLACTRKRLCLHARTPNDQMFTRPLPVFAR